MQKLIIEGEKRLYGEALVQGAKNSALPLLAACLLCEGETLLHNCPKLSDVYAACRILGCLGCECRAQGNDITVRADAPCGCCVPDDLMREMRSSIVFLGAVLGRTGECSLSFPGGCELGPRPIDMHLAALRRMGAEITERHGVLRCTCPTGLKGTGIILPFPSVGATENIILAAALAEGTTVIKNAAREPEIADLCCFLRACGARIIGEGSDTVVIEGVGSLQGCEYTVMPDRIVAATLMSAAAITGGEVSLIGARSSDLDAVIPVFEEMGCRIYTCPDRLFITRKLPLSSVRTVRTMPYPGFPTDAQALVTAVLAKAKGTSIIVENIFENRFRHVDELVRMGARIKAEGKVAVIDGVPKLYGAKVRASDLRGGAALAVAALAAEGVTEIGNVGFIDRGYEALERQLSSLGASASRECKI
ncbi:MAG: UDP-N-acetylglucosamine 1-carboxyvinyltransferase [Ruminococcus sp.]|nr:UDP-N-acetylglucosamine 1-carboxyvinyltransferase [Ruminococcus sp.]